MFNYLEMGSNYKERKVDNTKVGEAEIDTCAISDSDQPYETGIEHPRYNEGNWVIVEMYDDKEAAVLGHERWCNEFKDGKLPPHLEDVSTCGIKQLIDVLTDSDDVKELSAPPKRK